MDTMDNATHEKIVARVGRYNDAVAAVRADPSLSDLGRAQKIADHFNSAQADTAAMKNAGENAAAGARAALERKLFGVKPGADPSAVISMRDAQDRAGTVESAADLDAMMTRARSIGDDTLFRAGLGEAITRANTATMFDPNDWSGVATKHAAVDPALANDVATYSAMTAPPSRVNGADIVRGLARHIPLPPELSSGYASPQPDGSFRVIGFGADAATPGMPAGPGYGSTGQQSTGRLHSAF